MKRAWRWIMRRIFHKRAPTAQERYEDVVRDLPGLVMFWSGDDEVQR